MLTKEQNKPEEEKIEELISKFTNIQIKLSTEIEELENQ